MRKPTRIRSINFHPIVPWLAGLAAAVLCCAAGTAWATLKAYDAAIAADAANNVLTPVATLTSPATLTGSAGVAFDFGATFDDVTIEFIVAGNPAANIGSYLAVGQNAVSSLRYEGWNDTGQLGFTQGGVADYLFTPGVPSPTQPTHVVYVWDSASLSMSIYTNGVLAGTTTDVSPAFAMPTGSGWLGSSPAQGEAMVGTIYRVTVYDDLVAEASILEHASAFLIPGDPALDAYDAAIAADAAGGLAPLAKLENAVTLTGAGGVAFDFGTSSGDVTIEFILEGDPSVNEDSFLAVGANSVSSLRYEAWSDTGELGFTQGGVADYQFTPGVPSPTTRKHIAYAWNSATLAMNLYVNGALAGTAAGVSASFAMPTGQGWLGANPLGLEAMVGTIYRMTVYTNLVPTETIRAHANAYRGLVNLACDAYDAAVADDADLGLVPVAKLFDAVKLTGAGGMAFDFGATSGDVTMEFILEGNPAAINPSGYLAVGANSVSNLRYDQYENTAKLGFTQLGVADYMFTPAVPSPLQPAHVAFVWDSVALSMKVYVNGLLGGVVSSVSTAFSMPAGTGWLGANPAGTEAMVGTIYRVTVYGESVPEETLQQHATAFTSVTRPPIIASFVADPGVIVGHGSSTLSWEVQNALAVFVNGSLMSETNLTVSPKHTTTYTLLVTNTFANATAKVTVQVSPVLDGYDALITADEGNGFTPIAKLDSAIALAGAGGVAFDFGANSGDVAIEFILEGDPASTFLSGYLAVGANPDSTLRYDQYNQTAQLGVTQLRVADYFFTPVVLSPTWPTHVTYVWDSVGYTMKVYVNGFLAGTLVNVSPSFVMPSGMGWLGSNPGGTEAMMGTIYRVTVYDDVPSEEMIMAHANAFMASNNPAFYAYDAAIAAEADNGLTPTARLFAPVTLPGSRGLPFDFGATADDVTIEFILEGDPSANVDGFLAVGQNSASSLRYEQWFDTTELGFTQGGVADYQFTPGVPSPTETTHLTYAWNAATTTMNVYTNGSLAGTVVNVSPSFAMPTGPGWLGANPGGTEAMTGTMYRVTVFDSLLSEDAILAHANAYFGVTLRPALALDLSGPLPAVNLRQGVAGAHYQIEYRDSLKAVDPWKVLEDIPALSGTTARVEDPTPLAGRSQRFYRAVRLE